MKNKMIFLVLDGFDYSYIIQNINKFSFFKKLYESRRLNKLESVVPADSIPSWTTIYTGLNPAQHGVLESIDYLNDRDNPTGNASIIKGNSFWDVLSEKGKKVFVYNPFIAYPAWDVNGVMVCGAVFEGGDISTNRPDIVKKSELPPLGGLVDHPTKENMKEFFDNNMQLTQAQFDSFKKLFEEDTYDFAFCGILASDRMQHFLWKYCDETDRCHPKGNALKNTILEMYQLMERNVEDLFNRYSSEYDITVISDHGHGRRCQKTFYINRWLIDNKYIPEKSLKNRIVEYAKNGMLTFLAKTHHVQKGSDFFKKFKFARKVKNADYVFKKKKQRIYAPNFDGVNPFGGINVDRSYFSSVQEYEKCRQDLIDGLMSIKDHNKSIMLWAKRREDVYSGENVRNYPEIVYRMLDDYGVDRGLFGKRLFGISAFHEVISGGHRFEGVIMGTLDQINDVGSVLNIHDYVINSVK